MEKRIGSLQTQAPALPFDPTQINTAFSNVGDSITAGINNFLSDNVRVVNSAFSAAPRVFSFLPAPPTLPQPQAIQSMNLPQIPGLPDINNIFSNLPFPIPSLPGLPGGAPSGGSEDTSGLGGSLGEDFWRESLDFRE